MKRAGKKKKKEPVLHPMGICTVIKEEFSFLFYVMDYSYTFCNEKLICIPDLISNLIKPKLKKIKVRVGGLHVCLQPEIPQDHYCRREEGKDYWTAKKG